MNKETLEQAYQWFLERGFDVEKFGNTLCLKVWNESLEYNDYILIADAEVQRRAEQYNESRL
jgi:hypothetical protein